MGISARFQKYKLTAHEANSIHELTEDPVLKALRISDQEDLVRTTAKIVKDSGISLPILRSLSDPAKCGLLILTDLPIVERPQLAACAIGAMMGEVKKYPFENDYIVEIKEQVTQPGERPSFKNAREFFLHTDLSYEPEPPSFFLMHAVTNDDRRGGLSTFCDINKAVSKLGSHAIGLLEKETFIFESPAHYQGPALLPEAILDRREDDLWEVRFRRDSLRSVSRNGILAVVELIRAMRETTFETLLDRNSMVIINNRTFLHGRTAFLSTTEPSEARLLLRLYASLN